MGKIHNISKVLKKSNTLINPRLYTNSMSQYIINENSLNFDNLLFICDSYSEAHSQLYNKTFRKVFKMHYKYFYCKEMKEFITKNKPDIIIYQIVERNLFNMDLFKNKNDL